LFQKYKYHFLLHLIIFIWGFTGILGKLITLDFVLIVWYRVFIAAAFLACFFYFTKKSFKVDKKHWWKIGLVGLIVASHWLTFYYAIQLSTASLGILCLSTTTLHVTWLEPIVMKRKFSWLEFALGTVVIYGIYFVSGNFSAKEMNALYIGLTSALCAAMFSVFNGRLVHDVPSTHLSFYELSTGFIAISVFLLMTGRLNFGVFSMTYSDMGWLLFLGILCTSFAFLVTMDIVKRLGAFTVSLSINLEPVYTILLAIFILKEHKLLNSNFYIGSAIIILVVVLNGILKHFQNKKLKINITEHE
jgi:drug/metabolite transporter (DMT)-like permease